ncbi:hypothetical protein K431DRAFT_313924 [Polychaeton citri CBS 116435]|uniref:Xaa-Pro aminopeptidase n=1 Tax=Polychaeton citri CBS 116435 TaxID=1314669 RepID=A0A9P4Q323_9PEZI|nr:hypothetical protein K431DRAFT_313924 [Polychaeton citri CBS 116435]
MDQICGHELRSVSLKLTVESSGIDKYPAKAHAQRVADTLKLSEGLIALAGKASELWQDSDMPVPFRQDRYFSYMTGCNEPDCYVTYDVGKDLLTLWIPPFSQKKAVWGGQGSTVQEALEKYDVDEVRYITVEKEQQREMPYFCRHVSNWFRPSELTGPHCKGSVGSVSCPETVTAVPLKQAIDICRVVKDEHEIELIRKANSISAKAHTAILKALPGLTSEAEVHAVYVGTCIAHQAREQAYQPIVGSGPNAATLHYATNNESFGDRQTLLIDAGAEWNCYASDVTRTMPLNAKNPGHWQSKEAEDIYALVEEVQESCIRMLKPGTSFLSVHIGAQAITLSGLLSLGILQGDFIDVWNAGTVRAFFPHGLGHHIGLECHDVSGEPRPSQSSSPQSKSSDFFSNLQPPCTEATPELVPGNVVTIEPGIYFNSANLKLYLESQTHAKFFNKEVLERYSDVGGVRIEDCILITKFGHENLTTAPKGAAALRIIREAASL